jgi:hypothetical protein
MKPIDNREWLKGLYKKYPAEKYWLAEFKFEESKFKPKQIYSYLKCASYEFIIESELPSRTYNVKKWLKLTNYHPKFILKIAEERNNLLKLVSKETLLEYCWLYFHSHEINLIEKEIEVYDTKGNLRSIQKFSS